MITHVTILLIGFSIFSALILLFAYLFFLPDMRKSPHGKVACAFLLLGISCLQGMHYIQLVEGGDFLSSRAYLFCLLLAPPSFYFFSRVVLFPDSRLRAAHCLHVIPLTFGSLSLPVEWVPGFAFLLGTGYTFWFTRVAYNLKEQSARFKFEMFFFGMFALLALIALALGLSLPYMDHTIFYLTYANSISISLLLVLTTLIVFPELLSDIALITEMAYAKSKLNDVDCSAVRKRLEQLMQEEKVYEEENLSLSSLADMLELSTHQLSELINTQYGYGFPRFVREQRVEEAKRLLLEEPTASVLSISMMTGFKSQSSFYAAFREITGVSPGNFRKSENN